MTTLGNAARAAALTLTVLAASATVVVPGAVQAANPLLSGSQKAQVVGDDALDTVKGSGVYADYYGYYGFLYALYALQSSYYGRYYYTSGTSDSANAYYNAYNYAYYAYLYNYYAYYYNNQ